MARRLSITRPVGDQIVIEFKGRLPSRVIDTPTACTEHTTVRCRVNLDQFLIEMAGPLFSSTWRILQPHGCAELDPAPWPRRRVLTSTTRRVLPARHRHRSRSPTGCRPTASNLFHLRFAAHKAGTAPESYVYLELAEALTVMHGAQRPTHESGPMEATDRTKRTDHRAH